MLEIESRLLGRYAIVPLPPRQRAKLRSLMVIGNGLPGLLPPSFAPREDLRRTSVKKTRKMGHFIVRTTLAL
jgi:hypothetical protein